MSENISADDSAVSIEILSESTGVKPNVEAYPRN